MRKIKILMISLLVLCILTSCSPLENLMGMYANRQRIETQTQEKNPVIVSENKYTYYYNHLTENEKEAYDAIYEGVLRHMETIPIVTVTEEEIYNVFRAVSYDNPELICLGCSYEWGNLNGSYYLKPAYIYTQEVCKEKTQILEKEVDRMIASLEEGMDEYQIEKTLHDQLVSSCYYDMVAAADYDGHQQAFNAYGALIDKRAVCEGYGRAIALLLNRVGIQNYMITGFGENVEGEREGHLWNIVTIDGANYHLDATYNDPFEESSDEVSHLYFNLSDQEIQRDHFEMTPDNNGCNESEGNYFVREGLLFSGYTEETKEKLVTVLTRMLEQEEDLLEIQFVEEEGFFEALSKMMEEGEIYDLLEQAEKNIETRQFDQEEVYYIDYGDARVIQLQLAVIPKSE